ncbi:MAG: 1-acyl-sn-glycerol-3-phosphate acyltransferase [Ruminococcaceae bacterium]|nr:1-acyl-sn-glycerol-3-phosphate acyltransferase [Oscillospiraceae bacterium]
MTKFYAFCHHCLAVIIKIIFRVKVLGLENEPEKGGHLVCANHSSLWDPAMLGACLKKRQVRFMAKAELFKIPILGFFFKALGAFPVNRKGGDIKAIKTTIELVQNGECVGIFPQGTRCRGVSPRTTTVKGGTGMCAYRGGCDIIPVAIVNKKRKMSFFGKTYVVIGAPIKFDELGFVEGDKTEFERASKIIFDRICDLYDECYSEHFEKKK